MRLLRELVVPAYLFACIVFGGSSQAVWGALALQLIAILILAWATIEPGPKIGGPERILLLLCSLLVTSFLLQLFPLPPLLWTRFPGREILSDGYRTLGRMLPWLPLSVAPYDTLATVLTLMPPFAVIAAVLRLRAYKAEWCAAAILAGTIIAILLGYLQLSTGKSGNTAWYIYRETNVGSAVGFFANRNHMGTLLLIAVAFVPPLFLRPTRAGTSAVPLALAGISALAVLLLGIAMNGSLATVILSIPVLAASASAIPAFGRVRRVLASAAAVGVIAASIFLASSPVQPKVTGETVASIVGRQEIWKLTTGLIRRTFPVGTGFGSFENVYASGEPLAKVEQTYVNHAHNDYLELTLEGGIVACLLSVAFLVWWFGRAWTILSSPASDRFEIAATIASGAVLAHSVVDYPLRTSAISAIFALCVALMARTSRGQRETGSG